MERYVTKRSVAMSTERTKPEAAELPDELLEVAQKLPAKIDRRTGAALVSKHIFPTSWRTVGGWNLDWEYPNGCCPRLRRRLPCRDQDNPG